MNWAVGRALETRSWFFMQKADCRKAATVCSAAGGFYLTSSILYYNDFVVLVMWVSFGL